MITARTIDRVSKEQRVRERERWLNARKAEYNYAVRLRSIARMVGQIVNGYAPDFMQNHESLESLLLRYSDIIKPWARSVAAKMLADVSQRDKSTWMRHSRNLGVALRDELEHASTGVLMREALEDQVDLITSLPKKAAQRVHKLTTQALTSGERAASLARDIVKTGPITERRALLIARTEVARTASALVIVRAQAIGCTEYFWRTAKDSDVRHSHKLMEGKTVRFAQPPTLDGMTGHAGQFPNCFTPDTLAGPIERTRKVFRAFYSGQLIILRVGDSEVKVTPNHPILTPNGWCAAGLLDEGDNIIQVPDKRDDVVVDDVDNRFLPIGEIFESLVPNVKCAPLLEHDFYGDVFNGEIEVVRSKLDLSVDGNSVPFERFGDNVISSTNAFVELCRNSLRVFAKVNQSLLSCFGDVRDFLLFRFGVSDHLICDASASYFNSVFFENSSDRHSSDTAALRDRPDANARSVLGHDKFNVVRIVNKRVIQYSGHVYTLETMEGHYNVTPARIVAKNCRCYIEPILPDKI